jgi:hypothetical protein
MLSGANPAGSVLLALEVPCHALIESVAFAALDDARAMRHSARGQDGPDTASARLGAAPFRLIAPGATPMKRLNARLKAASD